MINQLIKIIVWHDYYIRMTILLIILLYKNHH